MIDTYDLIGIYEVEHEEYEEHQETQVRELGVIVLRPEHIGEELRDYLHFYYYYDTHTNI
jgi:hypothetical protein